MILLAASYVARGIIDYGVDVAIGVGCVLAVVGGVLTVAAIVNWAMK